MKILVVEDEPALRQQLADAMGNAGYAVDCAPNGERADFLGQTESYDAAILDLGLPKVDGLTVLRRWRDAGMAMPVLILTGDASPEAKKGALSLGAKDFIAKPFDPGEVILRIHNLLETRSLYLSLQKHNADLEARVRERTRELEQVALRPHPYEFHLYFDI